MKTLLLLPLKLACGLVALLFMLLGRLLRSLIRDLMSIRIRTLGD